MTSPKPAVGAAETYYSANSAIRLLEDIRRHMPAFTAEGVAYRDEYFWHVTNDDALARIRERDAAIHAELQSRCDRLAAQVTDTRNSAIKAFAEILRLGDSHRTRPDREYVDRELVIDILMRMKREVYALRAGKEGGRGWPLD